MFRYPCPKCHRPCRLDEGLQCSNCKKNSNPGAGMYASFDPEQPVTAVPKETGVASGPRNHLDPNIMLLDTTVLVQNGKSNKPNNEIIQNIIQHNTQSRQEICKITDRNLDFMQETNTATNDMTSSYSHSVKIREATRNNEPQWNIGIFQGPQKDNSPVNEALLNNESWGNIAQYQGAQKDNAPVNEAFRNNEFQWDMSKFHISQNYDAPVKISDPREPFGESVHFGDGILAVSGPSGFHKNQNVPNELDMKFKTSNATEIRSVEVRKKPEIFLCKYCGKGIDEHTKTHPSEYPYFCCVCEYDNKTQANLQEHICIHCPKDDCSVCSKEHTDGSLHDGEQMCLLCPITFNCRTRLDEHLLEHHRPHFKTHCWVCNWSICDHHFTFKEGKILYFCCICGLNTRKKNYILSHNDTHLPKIFCNICREEYPEEQKGLHNREYSCFKCPKEFKCRTQLEDHYKDDSHVDYFSVHCRFCNESLNKHAIQQEENQYYKCCAYECPFESKTKSNLKAHIDSQHPGLGIFKCGTCGKRYKQKSGLNDHSKKCIPSPFPCEICRARFPSYDSLNKHSLDKHRPDIRFPV